MGSIPIFPPYMGEYILLSIVLGVFMKTNFKVNKPIFTYEGGPSSYVPPLQRLKRLTMACMLWEDTFYVDGKTVADQISDACDKVNKDDIIQLASDIHDKGLLRHVPLYLILQALKKKGSNTPPVSGLIEKVCSRPDQMTELLSLYWKEGKKPIAAQLKKGLAKAFTRFDEYQLAKYNRDAPIKLKDILFLCHAKPKDEQQAEIWKRLISDTLKTPDTWETRLSDGQDKKESFSDLLFKEKMGRLAIVRNLRNMQESGVDKELVRSCLMKKSRPLLPFQFLSAAKECPKWEDIVDEAMIQSCSEKEKISGKTLILVDVSGSMDGRMASKSKVSRIDAASGLSILLRELCYECEIYSFSNTLAPVPLRRGMALRDAIFSSQQHGGTYLGQCLMQVVSQMNNNKNIRFDRLIVITDEQVSDHIPVMPIDKCYIMNIANYENGIKNTPNNWLHIHGFSEHSVDYIREIEGNSCIIEDSTTKE